MAPTGLLYIPIAQTTQTKPWYHQSFLWLLFSCSFPIHLQSFMVQKRVHASFIPMGSVQRMQKKGTVKGVILLEHAAAEEIVGRHALPWAATLMPSSVLLPPVKTAAVVSTFERLYETVMKFTLRTQMQTLAVLTTWTN